MQGVVNRRTVRNGALGSCGSSRCGGHGGRWGCRNACRAGQIVGLDRRGTWESEAGIPDKYKIMCTLIIDESSFSMLSPRTDAHSLPDGVRTSLTEIY